MSTVLEDCRQLSSGTIGTLTGANYYEEVDAARAEFCSFVESHQGRRNWETWIEAWDAFASMGHRKVGSVYGEFRGRALYHYRCSLLNDPRLDGIKDGCCHFSCRLKMLHDAGYHDLADQLERNAKAKDWLGNWGKLLYDPKQHGRDLKRRTAAAGVVRAMRRGDVSHTDAVWLGSWTGANIDSPVREEVTA